MIPTLLKLMFGEAAGIAQRGVSPRFLLWSRAFDDWLAERERSHPKSQRKYWLGAWRRLYKHCDKAPWELRQADIAEHVERLMAAGYKPKTINTDLSVLANYFRWCSQEKLDPECEPSFNPCDGAPRPKVRGYQVSEKLLTRREVEALLRTLRADRSPLGLRDHALILARLNLGIPFHRLLRLQWGQIQAGECGAWVRWQPEEEAERMPDEAWEAMRIFVEETGRLQHMTEEAYIFVGICNLPTVYHFNGQPKWSEKPLSNSQALYNLKLYGRKAGIPEEKLNMQTLRRTAIHLQLSKAEDLEQIQTFAGWRGPVRDTNFRLQPLKRMPEEPGETCRKSEEAIETPNHKSHVFQTGDGYVHGFRALSQPRKAVLAVLAEDIQGLGEQIAGLRALGRGAIERQMEAGGGTESYRMIEMYTLTAGRLAEMIWTEEQLAKRGKDGTWANEFLDSIDQLCRANGESFDREAVILEAVGNSPELAVAARHLREETATLRFLLRNTLKAAIEAQNDQTYLRMVDLYGEGSVRLARMLRRQKADEGVLAAYLNKVIDQAVEEVLEGWTTE